MSERQDHVAGHVATALVILAMAFALALAGYEVVAQQVGARFVVMRGAVAERPGEPCTFMVGGQHTLLVFHPLNVQCQRMRAVVAAGGSWRVAVEEDRVPAAGQP